MKSFAILILATLACALTGGCGTLSGAASMQVEVDAYTGPLSQGREAQIAHTMALVQGATLSFRMFLKDIKGEYPDTGTNFYKFCDPTPGGRPKVAPDKLAKSAGAELEAEGPQKKADLTDLCYEAGRVIIRLADARNFLLSALQGAQTGGTSTKDPQRPNVQDDSQKLAPDQSDWSASMKRIEMDEVTQSQPQTQGQQGTGEQGNNQGDPKVSLEFYWLTFLQLHGYLQDRSDAWTKRGIFFNKSPDVEVQRRMAQFASLAGHYGQLIGSRTDVLLKQLQVQCNLGDQWSEVKECISRKSTHPDKLNWWNPAARRLATLEYLRDSTADEHMQQFRWLKLEPDGVNTMSVDEAVRASRMLFENNYWTNVNRVSASGRGEVRMALIKDDIGNWSLKSFDNNPEELLGAYRDATVAGIGALAKIAKKGTMPAGDAIIGFASSLAQGKVAPQGSSGNVDQGIASARTDLLAALTDIETELSTASAQIATDETAAKSAVTDAEAGVVEANKAVARNEALITGLDAIINDPPDGTSPSQLETLATRKANAQAELAAAQSTQALSNAKLNEAKAKLAQVEERRANAGQRAIEKAQLELKAYQRALTAIQKMAASATAPAPASPALPIDPGLPAPGG